MNARERDGGCESRERKVVDDTTVCWEGEGVCCGPAKFSNLHVRRGKGRCVLLPTAAACGSGKVRSSFFFLYLGLGLMYMCVYMYSRVGSDPTDWLDFGPITEPKINFLNIYQPVPNQSTYLKLPETLQVPTGWAGICSPLLPSNRRQIPHCNHWYIICI